jgi:hypothetical protein
MIWYCNEKAYLLDKIYYLLLFFEIFEKNNSDKKENNSKKSSRIINQIIFKFDQYLFIFHCLWVKKIKNNTLNLNVNDIRKKFRIIGNLRIIIIGNDYFYFNINL